MISNKAVHSSTSYKAVHASTSYKTMPSAMKKLPLRGDNLVVFFIIIQVQLNFGPISGGGL